MALTGRELYDNFLTEILDGEQLSETLAISLFNVAKNRYESIHQLRFLLTEDSSQTRSSGDSYTTAKTLPSNFASMGMGQEGEPTLYIGENLQPYRQAAFEDRRLYKDRGGFFIIDIGAGQFFLTDNASAGATGTIYLPYFQTSTDLTTLPDSFSRWPERFLPLIAFTSAAMFRGGTDFDDVNARMKDENRYAAQVLLDAMLSWNAKLTIQSRSQATFPRLNLSV